MFTARSFGALRTEANKDRNRTPRCARLDRHEKLLASIVQRRGFRLLWRIETFNSTVPILKPDEQDIGPILILREIAARVQQLLKYLVVRRELQCCVEFQPLHPMLKRFGDWLRCKGGGDKDRLPLLRSLACGLLRFERGFGDKSRNAVLRRN